METGICLWDILPIGVFATFIKQKVCNLNVLSFGLFCPVVVVVVLTCPSLGDYSHMVVLLGLIIYDLQYVVTIIDKYLCLSFVFFLFNRTSRRAKKNTISTVHSNVNAVRIIVRSL